MCIWPVSKLVAVLVCWFPRELGSVCDKCTEGRVLLQYASNSSSPRPCAPSGHWSPREAEGTVQYYFVYLEVVSFHGIGHCHSKMIGGLKAVEFFGTYSGFIVLSMMLIMKTAYTVLFFILRCVPNVSLESVSWLQKAVSTKANLI